MAQGQGDGVGRVDRAEGSVDAEEGLHHALHLLLVGAAVAGDRLLDLVRRVLDHLGPGGDTLDHGEACGLRHRNGRASVDLEQHTLDRHHRRPVLRDELAQVVAQGRQPLRHGLVGFGAQDPGGEGPRPPALLLDHAVAAALQPGVDAENEHGFGP